MNSSAWWWPAGKKYCSNAGLLDCQFVSLCAIAWLVFGCYDIRLALYCISHNNIMFHTVLQYHVFEQAVQAYNKLWPEGYLKISWPRPFHNIPCLQVCTRYYFTKECQFCEVHILCLTDITWLPEVEFWDKRHPTLYSDGHQIYLGDEDTKVVL